MKYTVEITETLQKQIEVEANSDEEAIEKVSKRYKKCEIVLDSNNHKETTIEIID